MGLGDVRAGVRYEPISLGEYDGVPGIALQVAVVGPTGRPTDRSESTVGADVTGRGAWVLTGGVTIERTMTHWFWRADLGATVPLPRQLETPDVRQRFGPGGQAALSAGYEWQPGLVTSAYVRGLFEAKIHHDGDPIPHSTAHETAAGVALSWRMAEHWTWQANVEAPLTADHLGSNRFAYLMGTVGIRYGYWNF